MTDISPLLYSYHFVQHLFGEMLLNSFILQDIWFQFSVKTFLHNIVTIVGLPYLEHHDPLATQLHNSMNRISVTFALLLLSASSLSKNRALGRKILDGVKLRCCTLIEEPTVIEDPKSKVRFHPNKTPKPNRG